MRPIIFDSVFPFLKEKETFACLSPNANNADYAANLFFDVFDEKREFVPTDTLKRVVGRFAMQGNEKAEIKISGPSSVTNQTINESGIAVLVAVFTKFFNVEPRIYNRASINDIITLDNDNSFSNS